MKIAIGTLKAPKVEGIKTAIHDCPYFSSTTEEIVYILEAVESGISAMPLSMAETMEGAKNRAQNLKKKGIQADFYVGMEGGVTPIADKKYIFGTVYVENPAGEGHFGFSPMMEVPSIVEKKLYEEKLELGPVMSELAGILNIQSQNGSMSAWSEDMLKRNDEFEFAFKAAISPFYNKYYQLD